MICYVVTPKRVDGYLMYIKTINTEDSHDR
jgi:hypothetical protein